MFKYGVFSGPYFTEYGSPYTVRIQENTDQKKLRIWSNLLKKSLMENFIFLCSVQGLLYLWEL